MVDSDVIAMLELEHLALADYLEKHSLVLLTKHIRCLRGEEMDETGLGLWRIFTDSISDRAIEQLMKNLRVEWGHQQ